MACVGSEGKSTADCCPAAASQTGWWDGGQDRSAAQVSHTTRQTRQSTCDEQGAKKDVRGRHMPVACRPVVVATRALVALLSRSCCHPLSRSPSASLFVCCVACDPAVSPVRPVRHSRSLTAVCSSVLWNCLLAPPHSTTKFHEPPRAAPVALQISLGRGLAATLLAAQQQGGDAGHSAANAARSIRC
jgi:hypothetical protein